jgi:hypothetical protein
MATHLGSRRITMNKIIHALPLLVIACGQAAPEPESSSLHGSPPDQVEVGDGVAAPTEENRGAPTALRGSPGASPATKFHCETDLLPRDPQPARQETLLAKPMLLRPFPPGPVQREPPRPDKEEGGAVAPPTEGAD